MVEIEYAADRGRVPGSVAERQHPTLVEICYFQKHRKELPQSKVRNQKRA